MTAVGWDPTHYLTYADERLRPFVELLARVDADPRRVVDLGCGPGNATQVLARRWPDAEVVGIDSSRAMVERARADVPGVRFEIGDVRDGLEPSAYDLVVSNATFQWVPDHLPLLGRLHDALPPGGTLAFSVPGNFEEPSHVLRRDLAAQEPYAGHSRTSWTRRRTTRRPTSPPSPRAGRRWTRGRPPTSTCCAARTPCSRG